MESTIRNTYPFVPIDLVTLDLSSIHSITNAATEISSIVDKLDVLINNAGITLQARTIASTPGQIPAGLQLFVNHIGPFLFTELLLPRLFTSESLSEPGWPRVVNLSSHGHRLSPIRFSDYTFNLDLYRGVPEDERPPSAVASGLLQKTDGYPGFIAYGQSKTANILHTVELNNRFQRSGHSGLALSVYPGTIDTGLSRNWDESGQAILGGTAPGGVSETVDHGAATTIVAAFDPELRQGEKKACWYLAGCQIADDKLAHHAIDQRSAARLWEETERMLCITSTGSKSC